MHWSQCLTDNVERYCVHFDFIPGLGKINPPYVFVGEQPFDKDTSKPTPPWIPIDFPLFRRLKERNELVNTLKSQFNTPDSDASDIL